MLVILTGLPGTGKTTVGRALAADLGAVRLSTDELRRRVFSELGYTERKKKRVYDELLRVAADQLRLGRPVVLDGTFFREALRREALRTAAAAGIPGFVVEVASPEPVVMARLEKRPCDRKTEFSEAGPAAYYVVRKQFEPVRGPHPVVDTADEAALPGRVAALANDLRVLATERGVVRPLAKARGMRILRTPISWVMVGGGDAFKIKKPVRLGFLDYSTLAKRRRFCRRELCVNAVLGGDLYRGVERVTKARGGVRIGAAGRAIEYAVRMREMPQERRLDALVSAGKAGALEIAEIAGRIAGFHARAPRAPRRFGRPAGVRADFEPAFEARDSVERECGAGGRLDEVRARVDAFLESQGPLFAARVAEGRIRRCHGDIRAANIFLDEDRVYIFDAIEFNDAIASCDTAADVAFLAMDLAFFRRPDLSRALVDAYVAASGDEGARGVLPFYETYRALVRMMTESAVLEEPDASPARKARARAALLRYLRLAERFSSSMRSG